MKIYLCNYNTGGYGSKWKALKKLFKTKASIKTSYFYDKTNLIQFIQNYKK